MQPDEREYLMEQTALAGQVGQMAQSSAAAQYYVQEKEKTIVEAQLECESLLEEVRHKLKQDKQTYKEDGTYDWEPISDSERILTDMGVGRIMQTMKAYVNKESLLSNYSEYIINRRMLDFCQALNRNIFMKYELYFRLPTVEEAIEIIKLRLKEKAKIRVFAKEMLGIAIDQNKVEKELLFEMENRIHYEIDKVRKQKQKQNICEYELLFTELTSIVESVHQRAWKGEERGSFRRHTNISEIIGAPPSKAIQQQGGMFGWARR
jgi:hypothetical protein